MQLKDTDARLKESNPRAKAEKLSPPSLKTTSNFALWQGFLAISTVTALYGFSYLVVDNTIEALPMAL